MILDEPNWEEQRLAIVNVGRMPGVRHQIIQEGQSSEESSDNEDNADNQNFDTQLPTQHSVSANFYIFGIRAGLLYRLPKKVPDQSLVSRIGRL